MKRLGLAIASLLLPALARASEEAQHEHGHGGIPWAMLIFSTVNTCIFLFLIVRYAWPSIRGWVEDRRSRIVEELDKAERARRDAEQLKQEWQERLARLTTDIEVMRAQARAEIGRERDQILAAAQQAAAAIQRDAQRAAEQELRSAQEQLRQELARQAYTIATERIRQELSAADHERFIADFLQRVTS